MGTQTRHNLVVGLGKSGLSCVRHLAALGESVGVCDTRPEPPGLAALRAAHPDVAVHIGELDTAPFAAADRVVLSPGVDRRRLPPLAGTPVVGDIELFAQAARAPVAAITGTNGKSTVTTLVGAMAEASGRRVLVGGNLGRPALDLLADPVPELYVLELSSYQLESTHTLVPAVAALLNLSPHHLDRYDAYTDYVAAKARIFHGGGHAVLNRDDAAVAGMPTPGRQRVSFGLGPAEGNDFGLVGEGGAASFAQGARPLLPITALHVPGRHNQANVLAALAIADCLGLDEASCLRAAAQFHGLPHRMAWVAERDGVCWINDSKATNVGATVAALRGLEGPLVLIAGGAAHDADLGPLTAAAQGRLRATVLVGEGLDGLAAALRTAAPLHVAGDMEQAVRIAQRLARPGDSVLLSPARQSFDRYRDFEQRGERFQAAVQALLAAAGNGSAA